MVDTTARWMDLDQIAHIRTTFPQPLEQGWIADAPGEQTLEVHFHQPTTVRRLRLVFTEPEASRTQEFTIWSSRRGDESPREVLRQQFNFSPGGATRQVEEYQVDLPQVDVITVRVVPSIDGAPALARVAELMIWSQ